MPIVFNPEEEEQGTQGTQPTQAAQSGGMISGAGGSGVIGDQEPSKSGSYTNLRSYLDANTGAGKQMAQGITSQASQQADQARDQMQGIQDQFQSNVQSGGVDYGDQQKQMVSQVGVDPTQVDQGAFAKLRDATYTAPQTWGGQQQDQYNQFQQNYKNLQDKAQATGTEQGQRTLLQDTYNKPSYSRGEQGLDQMLLQAPGGGAREAFADLRSNIGSLDPQYQQYQQQGADAITARQNETNMARNEARGALGIDNAGGYTGEGAVGTFQTGLMDRLKEVEANRGIQSQQLEEALAAKQFTPEDFASMGLESGTRYYNMFDSPTNFISQDPFDASASLTQDEYSRGQALANLSGQDQNAIPFAADQSKIGTQTGVGYNKEAISEALGNSTTEYNNAYKSAKPLAGLKAKGDFKYLDVDSISKYTPYQLEYALANGGKVPGTKTTIPFGGSAGSGVKKALREAVSKWKTSRGYGNVA